MSATGNTNMPTVPFADLRAQYLSIKQKVDDAIADVIDKSAFVRGAYVEAFERHFAAAIGAAHCVSCGNGTDSLHIAMRALGVKPGDEVIVPAHSWISTSASVTQAGGTVVFCDTDDDETFTIDTRMLAEKVTPRTVGIIPVHLYGQSADMDAVLAVANRHRLWVVEDCAQAHLATYKGKTVGTFGQAGSFSFYPGKNLGAMGDAGAIVTNDAGLAERMAMFARHGGLTKGSHLIEGINSRMDGLQAAILLAKLPHLEKWTARRREIAAEYDHRLAGTAGIQIPKVAHDRDHVYHLYVIRTDERDTVGRVLTSRGVQTSIYYPTALPFLPAYSRLAHNAGDFPNAYRNQSRILALPMFPEMSQDQINTVIDAVRGAAG